MSDENSVTAGTKSRRTLRKVRTKFHTRRAVIRTVPTKASSAAFLSVMVVSMNAGSVQPQPNAFPQRRKGLLRPARKRTGAARGNGGRRSLPSVTTGEVAERGGG